MMRGTFITAILLCAALAAGGLAAEACAGAHARRTAGRAARVMRVRDEGRLDYRTDNATTIVDEGSVRGTIPGRARVWFVYNGSPSVSARFTIWTRGGWLSGWARCRLHNPTSRVPSFRGALRITRGGGRYTHARGSGELFGLFYRRGYGLVVQAIGSLRY